MKKESKMFPKVAIIGKPNVGKSSLFNLLIGRRKSLVSQEAGVTRDVVHSHFDINDTQQGVLLLDTGGISHTIQHDFLEATIEFATKELKEADIVLFVVDAQTGLTTDDFELITQIRKTKIERTILVVNKVDNDKIEEQSYHFYSHGFKDIAFVSCAHKRGIETLKEMIAEKLKSFTLEETENLQEKEKYNDQQTLVKVALLGKPNVGKSSFFNKVIGRYRSIVSPIAGTTRDVIAEDFIYKNRKIDLMDMAGFRRKPRIVEFIEKESVKKGLWALRKQDIILILLDSSEGVSEQDKKLVHLALKEKKALIVGLNKWDLIDVDPKSQKLALERFRHYLHLATFIPMIPFSIKTGKGIEKLLDTVVQVHKNYSREITPRDITLFLKEVIKTTPPFSKLGQLKIFYGVQISSQPPHFELFVNNPLIVNEAYNKFLQKKIDEHYQLLGIPVFLNFKARH